ncbi:MAG TPA: CRISPR-associated endonuclease Cas2 [Candidatus Paceibacterota bacterium]
MGVLEKDSKRRTRNNNIQKIILQTVATAGFLSVALLAPNALQAFKQIGLLPKPRQKYIFNLSRNRLVKAGLLTYEDKFIRLTTKGEAKLRQLELYNYKLKKPKRWDKKWRVLIFDVPEKNRSIRDKVRNTIITIGFMRLQKSVWVYPYDCEDFVNLIKADFKIGKDLLYLIVDSIENDKEIRNHFQLSLP